MKTRFDETKYWRTSHGEVLLLSEMETSHLMNTLRMLIRKPYLIASMLILDIESGSKTRVDNSVWTPNHCGESDPRKESVFNVTSMSAEQLVEYAFGTPLIRAMTEELVSRGVNVDNMVKMWYHEDDVVIKEKKNDDCN